ARSNRFDDNEIDVAISIGPVDDDRFISLPFLTRTFSPVCSPMTMAVYGRGDAEALQRAPIFYSELQINSWRLWCRAAGVPDIDLAKNGVRFENTSLAYQAARESTGFVIGQRLLLRSELDVGRMVMPFACIARSEVEYCLVYRRKDAGNARVRAFVDWLIAKAREVPEGRLRSTARPGVGA